MGREQVTTDTPAARGRDFDAGWALPELAGLAVFTVDPAGRVTWWSRATERLFGRPASGVRGQDIRDVLRPHDRDAVTMALAEANAGRLWSGLLAVCADDGGHRQFAFRWERMPHGPGEPGILVVAQPVAPAGITLLTEAGARIGRSLDLGETAREVVETAVPRFAAAASIYLLERLLIGDEFTHRGTTGAVVARRLATHVADYSSKTWAGTLPAGEVVVFPPHSPQARCVAGDRAVTFDRPDEELAERLRQRAGGAELVARYHAFLTVPLTARGSVVGFAVFARVGQRERFGPADVTIARELSARAAMCVENARLYSREQRTVATLQRSLAPRGASAPPRLDVAHQSLPAGAGIVGGDWLDVVELPGGRAALVVGDVMGHGTEAAAVMAQLRTAAHTLADLDLTPDQVLYRLDRVAQHLHDAPFGTCVYATVDPVAHTCAVARAGHLPPVLVRPDGEAAPLELPGGLPLGLGDDCFQTTEVPLPAGAVLALFSDGLVESRTRPFETGIAALCETLSKPVDDLDEACRAVVDALRHDGDDDITLMLARVREDD